MLPTASQAASVTAASQQIPHRKEQIITAAPAARSLLAPKNLVVHEAEILGLVHTVIQDLDLIQGRQGQVIVPIHITVARDLVHEAGHHAAIQEVAQEAGPIIGAVVLIPATLGPVIQDHVQGAIHAPALVLVLTPGLATVLAPPEVNLAPVVKSAAASAAGLLSRRNL